MATSMQNTSSSSTVLSSYTSCQNVKKGKSPYSNCSWLRNRLTGKDGEKWRRARIYQLLNKNYSKKLSWFNVDWLLSSVKSSNNKKNCSVKGVSSSKTNCCERLTWTDDEYHSLQILLNSIVKQWQPHLMDEDQNDIESDLHSTLTPKRLKPVRIIYGTEGPNGEKQAFKNYLNTLVPLHYHELWASIVRDYHSPEATFEERQITIDNVEVSCKQNLDTEQEATVIAGKTRIIFSDSFTHVNNRFSLFDLVVISIDQREYFGVIVCVEQVQTNEAKLNTIQQLATAPVLKPIKIELEMKIAIYVSDDCRNDVIRKQNKTKTSQLNLVKVTNITSTARMISAIHKLEKWPRYLSLLRPNVEDPYFQPPKITEHNLSTSIELKKFNKTQRKIIEIAENIFEDHEQDRLSIVVGPPGTGKSCTIAGCVIRLLPKLFEGNKLLICAPSNGACDELMRRILDEFKNHGIHCDNNTLVRIGGVPPDDENLCEYFHEFHILSTIFEMIGSEATQNKFNTYEIGKNIIKNAKIILSTLNHCASSRMQTLKDHVDFIIIDEACQSLEADCLNALRFGCTKIMLVGDPNQLPPTVMSKAGRDNQLDISLYDRLYEGLTKSQSGPITMLNIQYRMHKDICEFPNLCFYKNALITPPSVEKRSRNFPLRRFYLYNLENSTEIKDRDGSKRNEKEALVVKKLCHMLIDYLQQYRMVNNCSLNLQSEVFKSIGIMTPYKDQVRCFQDLNLPPGIEVMTVDGAQGKEKDIIIYSCVRNNDEDIGFLKDKRRLNVALTRAREALYVIGNIRKFARQPKNESWIKMVRYAESKERAESKDRNIIEDVDYDSLQLPIISKSITLGI